MLRVPFPLPHCIVGFGVFVSRCLSRDNGQFHLLELGLFRRLLPFTSKHKLGQNELPFLLRMAFDQQKGKGEEGEEEPETGGEVHWENVEMLMR